MLRPFIARLVNTFAQQKREQRLQRDVQDHLDLLAEEFSVRGLAPDEAARHCNWGLLP